MLEALQHGDPGVGPVPERLAAAGLEALCRVVTQPSTRSLAVALLAADALLTYACEAAVDADARPDALERLAHSLDLSRFADLLEEVER
jgi:hypothetical protein